MEKRFNRDCGLGAEQIDFTKANLKLAMAQLYKINRLWDLLGDNLEH
jgi:hypothetical protein